VAQGFADILTLQGVWLGGRRVVVAPPTGAGDGGADIGISRRARRRKAVAVAIALALMMSEEV